MQEVFKNSEVGTDSCKELWARVVRCPLGHFQVKIISSLEFRVVILLEQLHIVLEVQMVQVEGGTVPEEPPGPLFLPAGQQGATAAKVSAQDPSGCSHSSIRQDYKWPFSASFSFLYVFPEVTHKDF